MQNLFSKNQERPFSAVPRPVFFAFLFFILLQAAYHQSVASFRADAQSLPAAADKELASLLFLSDNPTAAKITMLWLQAFDNQPGISIPFANLDYSKVIEWLSLILELDDKIHYPLLSASRLYAQVPDEDRRRLMLDFIREEYLKSPNARWRWMAHAVHVAKHNLKDLDLALEYASLLRLNTSRAVAPPWVTQMEIFILEDMDEIESAKVLLGGFLESGEITDQHELNFLFQRLEELENK